MFSFPLLVPLLLLSPRSPLSSYNYYSLSLIPPLLSSILSYFLLIFLLHIFLLALHPFSIPHSIFPFHPSLPQLYFISFPTILSTPPYLPHIPYFSPLASSRFPKFPSHQFPSFPLHPYKNGNFCVLKGFLSSLLRRLF